MKSLLEHFKELKQEDWDYYYDFSERQLINPFNSSNNHTKFIQDYFKRSGKQQVLDFIISDFNSIPRANHTNSIYFLGILIYKFTSTNTKFFNETNPAGYNVFPFLWFLTCLYHDLGFQYENDEKLLSKANDVELLKIIFEIEYCLLKKRVSGVNRVLFENIRKYFLYRRYVQKKVDHGILAGLVFYDRLIRNRRTKEKSDQSLFWGKDLEKQYALVASTIAIHNIWLPDDKSACDYLKFEMKELINLKPIEYKNSPLLFLLGIVDTIDPIKAFSDKHKEDYILTNLEIAFDSTSIKLCNKSASKLDFEKLESKAEGLRTWLNISVEKEINCIILKFN